MARRHLTGVGKAARVALACAAAGVVRGAATPLAGCVGEMAALRVSGGGAAFARGPDTERNAGEGMHAHSDGAVIESGHVAGGVNDFIRAHYGEKSWLTVPCAAPSSPAQCKGENAAIYRIPPQCEEARATHKKVGVRKGELCWFSTAFLR